MPPADNTPKDLDDFLDQDAERWRATKDARLLWGATSLSVKAGQNRSAGAVGRLRSQNPVDLGPFAHLAPGQEHAHPQMPLEVTFRGRIIPPAIAQLPRCRAELFPFL